MLCRRKIAKYLFSKLKIKNVVTGAGGLEAKAAPRGKVCGGGVAVLQSAPSTPQPV